MCIPEYRFHNIYPWGVLEQIGGIPGAPRLGVAVSATNRFVMSTMGIILFSVISPRLRVSLEN